jgi:predicted nucleic acid-binding protein
MARKTDCYADTSAFIAFLDKSDSFHFLYRRLFATPPGLVTSALVIAEGHGWFLRRYDRYRAMQFLAFVHALPKLEIRSFDATELLSASDVLKRYPDQDLTLADAHGLAIMKASRIANCWSTDWHLGLAGATLAT